MRIAWLTHDVSFLVHRDGYGQLYLHCGDKSHGAILLRTAASGGLKKPAKVEHAPKHWHPSATLIKSIIHTKNYYIVHHICIGFILYTSYVRDLPLTSSANRSAQAYHWKDDRGHSMPGACAGSGN